MLEAARHDGGIGVGHGPGGAYLLRDGPSDPVSPHIGTSQPRREHFEDDRRVVTNSHGRTDRFVLRCTNHGLEPLGSKALEDRRGESRPPRRPSARATAHSTGAEADLINPSSSSSDHAVNRFVRPARAPCSSARLNSNASERALRMLPSARCATQRTSRLGSRAHSMKKSSVCSAPRSASASIAATRIPSAPVRATSSSSARASSPTCRTRTREPWTVSSSPSSGKP